MQKKVFEIYSDIEKNVSYETFLIRGSYNESLEFLNGIFCETKLADSNGFVIVAFDGKQVFDALSFKCKNIYYLDANNISQMLLNKSGIFVIDIETALKCHISAHEALNPLVLHKGETINMLDIASILIKMGYKQKDMPYNFGEFAIRGSIVDIVEKNAFRIDFFDNEIENIYIYDIDTQRRREAIDSISLGFNGENEEFNNLKTSNILEYLQNKKVVLLNYEKLKVADEIFKEAISLKDIDANVIFGAFDDFADNLSGKKYDLSGCFELDNSCDIYKNARDGIYAEKQYKKKVKTKKEAFDISFLNKGDIVVHELYGIGRFKGLCTKEAGGKIRDYILIEYAKPKDSLPPDELYLPVDQAGLIDLYQASDNPRLSRLGTNTFQIEKQKAERNIRKIVLELVKIYASRMNAKKIPLKGDSPLQRQFEDDFEYIATPWQEAATYEIKADLESSVPMDRLLVGDVGFGKTEVALRAAFKAIDNKYQVALLAPTTLLALQHFKTVEKRFRNFPINYCLLSRMQSDKQISESFKKIASGEIDLIVGTHKMLSDNLSFKNLRLLIIDEEQRFGVKAKEKIKEKIKDIDILSMSATPIPRSLEMSLSGIRSISYLKHPPKKRIPIKTFVNKFDKRLIMQAIKKELLRDGQVFYVHNDIKTINFVYKAIKDDLEKDKFFGKKDIAIAVGHAKLSDKELKKIAYDFKEGLIDILVSTTIVEAGLDIPNANTLIVENAQKYGLSQLHQLRGRVGRSQTQGYAYFFYKNLTDISFERLNTLKENSYLSSGHKIAVKDLEIRGAGNMLGVEQKGKIDGLGFDMYLRCVAKVINDFRGTKPKEQKFNKIDGFIPKDYIPQDSIRLVAYKQILNSKNLPELKKEFIDRFGKMPDEVKALFAAAERGTS